MKTTSRTLHTFPNHCHAYTFRDEGSKTGRRSGLSDPNGLRLKVGSRAVGCSGGRPHKNGATTVPYLPVSCRHTLGRRDALHYSRF